MVELRSEAERSGDHRRTPSHGKDARQVADDMESIFGESAFARSVSDRPQSRSIGPIVGRSSKGRLRRLELRAVSVGIVLLVGIGAVSIAITVHDGAGRVPSEIAREAVLPSQAFAEISPPATIAFPSNHRAASLNVKVMPNAGGASSKTQGQGPVRLVSRPTQALAQRHARRRDFDVDEPCAQRDRFARARCMRPLLINADRQLRGAYRHAVAAGVNRDLLVSFHRKWSRLRSESLSNPARVTVGYQEMARELDAARAGRRMDDI
jgi:hypothetical protein